MTTYEQERNPYAGWGMAAWPGTPSSCHCITFANGDNATVMGLRR